MRTGVMVGPILIALGLLTMAVPFYVFPVCDGAMTLESGRTVPMKCFWMARAELGAGAVVAILGLFCLPARAPLVRLGLCLATIPVAGLIAALPMVLIGVCAGPAMPCHAGTCPALVLLAIIIAVVSLIGCWVFRNQNHRITRRDARP